MQFAAGAKSADDAYAKCRFTTTYLTTCRHCFVRLVEQDPVGPGTGVHQGNNADCAGQHRFLQHHTIYRAASFYASSVPLTLICRMARTRDTHAERRKEIGENVPHMGSDDDTRGPLSRCTHFRDTRD